MPTRKTTPSKKKKVSSSQRQRKSTSPKKAAPFTIQNHCLIGPKVRQKETPNKSGEITPKYLVFHYTAGRSAQSSVNWLTNPASKASAHLVLGRDGSITQLAPFNVKTWHAGVSNWDGVKFLNQCSIGIEMDNAGPLQQVGTTFKAWFGKEYPTSQALHAKHKLNEEPCWWHTYTEAQIDAALELARLLTSTYGLKEIVGHEDIAPERKRDPGPAFPLAHIQSAGMGRNTEAEEEHDECYRVTASALNIRKGPGRDFEAVSAPLPLGTMVTLLEKRDRWYKVETNDEQDIEGWVFNKFLEAV
ncbi:N-acetylmuramoyl-L-alanine amidase [Candidatus Nitronereus thalassa]|uniref:N-acetylmuramoyl-L-alanine amidase n=1 Tax=Candidatus Nitronereus thalassa TaxID=3020898 RepID=A0ABU3K4Q1_9BACT|nr:N-acetylmuramoyl-L-alanine amidase [Candidatus Nitronereus thalassa]MDT7041347.1 N-acetylmuramoyl-L-alanine amidase [Candidatus Nitronereus thalassa]